MEYDPNYPTVLPPFIGLALIFVLNILIPISAIVVARMLKRQTWLPHTFAFLWVLFSTLTLAMLVTPAMAPDEEAGPGDGLILLPVMGETLIVLFIYSIIVLYLRSSRPTPSAPDVFS
jgi:hypothetical protein